MTIHLTKGRNKPDTLACFRNDGSCTWAALNLPSAHDVGHYAVETTLGFCDAFFGLLAQGWAIQDFGQSNPLTGEKPDIPIQGLQVEALVGLLDIERCSGLALDFESFHELMDIACAGMDVPTPMINACQLAAIRSLLASLLGLWAELPGGEKMELSFPKSLTES